MTITEEVEVSEHGEIVPLNESQSTDSVLYAPIPPSKSVGALPFVRDFLKLAHTISRTEMVPRPLQGRADAILAIFMRGYELGFAPMQSLSSLQVIEGQVGIKPEAMRALIFDAGHDIRLRELRDDDGRIYGVTAVCHRKEWAAGDYEEYTFTLDDAKQAELTNKSNWKKMPRSMLEARATAGAGRRTFSDVLSGSSYTPAEIGDFTEEVPPSRTGSPPQALAPGSPSTAPAPSPAIDSGGDPGAVSASSSSAPGAPIPPTANSSTKPFTDADHVLRPPPRPKTDSQAALVVDAIAEPDPTSAHAPAATTRQVNAIRKRLNEDGIREEADVLARVSDVLGRTIVSLTELTGVEATQAIVELAKEPTDA